MMMPIAEMREFAGFAPAEQRYIKRSLDIGLARTDAFHNCRADHSTIRNRRDIGSGLWCFDPKADNHG